jgi:hypothetical protein
VSAASRVDAPSPYSEKARRRRGHDKALGWMMDVRAYPTGRIPEGAYRRAREQFERMIPEPVDAEVGSDSESMWSAPRRWLARLRQALSPARAVGGGLVVGWTEMGPRGFIRSDGAREAGLVDTIAIDPSDPNRIYLGTPSGGLWKTADRGQSWTTSGMPSLQVEPIVVHPTNGLVIVAGTGLFIDYPQAVGTLRSVDRGVTWCEVGPSWPIGTANDTSTLSVVGLLLEPETLRVWAATSTGLWYSDDALDTATACADVSWTLSPGLPQTAGVPEEVNHVFRSPWTSSRLFASVVHAGPNNGWYRSTGGATGRNAVVQFDPTAGHVVTIPDDAALSPPAFTLEGWFRWDGVRYGGVNDWAAAAAKGTFAAGEYTLLMRRALGAATNALNCYINGKLAVSWSWSTPDTSWHHFACAYTGATASLYFDGILRSSAAFTDAVPNTGHGLRLGRQADGGYGWGGSLDEIRLYSTALTGGQIAAHYNVSGQCGTPEGSLIAGWHLDDAVGASASDYSGNGHDGTITGPVSLTGGVDCTATAWAKLPDTRRRGTAALGAGRSAQPRRDRLWRRAVVEIGERRRLVRGRHPQLGVQPPPSTWITTPSCGIR